MPQCFKKITVRSQEDMDAISQDYNGKILIASKCSITVLNRKKVEVINNSYVEARGQSELIAWDNSKITVCDKSVVSAQNKAYIVAYSEACVEARGESRVMAYQLTSVLLRDRASVTAMDNSTVEAYNQAAVHAYSNSSTKAYDNTLVDAWGNAKVVGTGNAQIERHSEEATITLLGNARLISPYPENIDAYFEFYGIDTHGGNAILYKAVYEDLVSNHDLTYQYMVGNTHREECDLDTSKPCAAGLHVSPLLWAINFGYHSISNFKILECSVPIDKIVMPDKCEGKVRTSELTVLRELPREEWGVMGRIV